MVVGTITHRQAPILQRVFRQMAEPSWVMSFGACTSSGGPVQQLRRRPGHRYHHPGRHLRAGLSAASAGGARRPAQAAGARATRAPRHAVPRPSRQRSPAAGLTAWRRSPSTATTLEVPDNSMLLPVLLDRGLQIPHYCYHPKLSIDGSCRMCLVKVEGLPKLTISCNTPVRDGMVVDTRGPEVTKARQGVLELLLVNHPLDCPICDQAGECYLQDYAFEYGRREARTQEPRRKLLEARRRRTARRARPGALHPVPAMRPLLQGDHRDARARRLQSGRPVGHRHVSGRASRERLLDLHRRHLSGRRAPQQGLPPQDARVVPRRDRKRLPELRERLQHQGRGSARSGVPLPAAPERSRERHLDVRRRAARVSLREREPSARSRASRRGARPPPSSWDDALQHAATALVRARAARGRGGGRRDRVAASHERGALHAAASSSRAACASRNATSPSSRDPPTTS